MNDFIGFQKKIHCKIFLKGSTFRINFKEVYSENDKGAMEMAIDSEYNDTLLKLTHPLNIITYKLYFASEQDCEDAIAVFLCNEEKIDKGELKDYCHKLGITDLRDEFYLKLIHWDLKNIFAKDRF